MPVAFPNVIDRVPRLEKEKLRVNGKLMAEVLAMETMLLRSDRCWMLLVIWIVCRGVMQ